MLSVSTNIIAEKNKIASTGAWLLMIDLDFPGKPTVRIVHDTNPSDLTWDGNSYTSLPMKIDDVREEGHGGLPTFTIQLTNVGWLLMAKLEEYAGFIGATATLRLVHSNYTASASDVIFEEYYSVLNCDVDLMWATITLGAENPMNQRCPKQRYLKGHCRYKEFKGAECGYTGGERECNRTLEQCQADNNTPRVGGFPGRGIGEGIYV